AALQHFLTAKDAADLPGLADIAYTLQVGRDPMAERLALVVDSADALIQGLSSFLSGKDGISGFFRGSQRGRQPSSQLAALPAGVLARDELEKVAQRWVGGDAIDWQAWHDAAPASWRRPRRVRLPGYPFAKQRCWLPDTSAAPRRRD